MAKATHTGTCQICGCNQKLPNGQLSKHGYTTQWGFFSGVCSGAHALPFEQSTGLIEEKIQFVKKAILALKAERIDLLEMTDGVMVVLEYTCSRRGARSHRWAKAPAATCTITGWSGSELSTSYTEEHTFGYGTETFECDYIYTGRGYGDGDHLNRPSLEVLIKRANAHYVKTVTDNNISQMEDYIQWQEKRVAGWVEKPLTPVVN